MKTSTQSTAIANRARVAAGIRADLAELAPRAAAPYLGTASDARMCKGARVRFDHPFAAPGKDGDQAIRLLNRGATYRIESVTYVGPWITYLWFREVPGVPFNSISFEVVQ